MSSFSDFKMCPFQTGDLFDGGEALFGSKTEIPLEVTETLGAGFSTEDEVREDRFFSVGGDGFPKDVNVERFFIRGIRESKAPIFCV